MTNAAPLVKEHWFDDRFRAMYMRFYFMSVTEVKRVIDDIDRVCFDTLNYDDANQTFCPVAIALNLHNDIPIPSDALVEQAIGRRFPVVNILKGLNGKFYRDNRREDLLKLMNHILWSKTNGKEGKQHGV